MPVERTEIGGRVQLQFNSTTGGGAASEFLVRRARIWAATRVNDWIDGAVQVDVSAGKAAARYAFVRLSLSESTRVSFGQFKRAFDLFELTSSSQILVVERDGGIRGVTDCGGVGRICSYSAFSESLQFSSVDVGVLVEGTWGGESLRYLASFTNGAGGNRREENDAKSASLRLEWRPAPRLRLGGNLGLHDHPDTLSGGDAFASAVALDAEWGDFDSGLHIQAGIMTGENWKAPSPASARVRFLTWQAIASYRIPRPEGRRIAAVEPVARISWGDPSRSSAGGGDRDGGWLLTPGFQLHFQGRNKFAANADVWKPASGATEWGVKLQTYLYF